MAMLRYGMPAILAALALGATASPSVAAPPQVDGKYAFVSHNICEARLTVRKNAQGNVTDVILVQAGMASASVGYITFSPTSATGGTAKITGTTLIEGGTLQINNNMHLPWTQGPDNSPEQAYSFTNTTFTYGGEAYRMVYG